MHVVRHKVRWRVRAGDLSWSSVRIAASLTLDQAVDGAA